MLTRLRLKKIVLSIDDFGSNHSSLAQLRDIPFDELKIDHGFVLAAHHPPLFADHRCAQPWDDPTSGDENRGRDCCIQA